MKTGLFFFFLNKKTNSYIETGEKEVTCLYAHGRIAFMLGCDNVKQILNLKEKAQTKSTPKETTLS